MQKIISLLIRYRLIVLMVALLKWMAIHTWIIHDWLGQDLRLAIWDSLISNILLAGLTISLINLLLNYFPVEGKFWYALGLSLAISFLWQWLVQQSMIPLVEDNQSYKDFMVLGFPIRWSIGYLVIMGACVSSIFYNQVQEQAATFKREVDTTTLAREAELQKLQLQLQPHFLFNSLNSINAMIQIEPQSARKMVEQLSDFLRITTKRADQQWIQFEEEWKFVELYLAIERVRFGHRLNITPNISTETQRWIIPTLVLQPLVENAIKFGLYGTTEKVTITIDALIQDNSLLINITNPFDTDMQPKKGSGFGLNGLRRRLYLLYAQNDLLQTKVSESQFTVSLKIPIANV